MPEGLTAIRKETFGECSALKEITIPAKVTTIGYTALYCVALKTLVFEGSLPVISSADENPDEQSEQLVLNNVIGNPYATINFSVFLPNITDQAVAQTYGTYFTGKSVYYNYQNTTEDGNKANSDNYTEL